MTPQQWARIRQIFESALDQPANERDAFIDVECAGDTALRAEVESLMANHDESGTFLNQPAADLAVMLVEAEESSSGDRPRVPQAGPYKLERCIARGGMGSVWLASRSDQAYERKVAIKMVKHGMDTAEILSQFKRERQLLAALDHPNIAGLLDAGSTPEGTPYLVMEYVEGIPIDHYLKRRQSSVTERLQLFRQVCSAVQYAHQNLVVHRDLKPSNILVSSDGVPKLLDFGIAKLLDPKEASETKSEVRAMTIDYASPEQVRGDAVTTQSDVYSLGVLLFKLLTGKLPYGRVHSREEFRRAICEREPLKASAVVVSNEKASIPQATEAIELGIETRDKARRRLRKKLSGDLDAILLKALKKEPLGRYLSAEQFSEDLRRYLENRPVQARGDNAAYRFSKFVHRNAAVLSVGVVVLAALVALGISAALIASRAEVQLIEAQTREAQLRSRQVRTLLALGEFDQRAGNARAKEDFALALEGAQGDRQITEANRGLGIEEFRAGNHLAAFARFTEALTAAEAWIKRERNNPDAYSAMAAANYLMGQALVANGETGAAGPKLHKAFEMFRDLAGSPDVNPEDQTAEAYEAAIRQLAKVAPAGLASRIGGNSLFAETASENH